MKLIKIITIISIAIMMMFLVSACGDDDYVETQPTGSVSDIGEAKAKEIVIEKVPGATDADIYEFEKEYDAGRAEYEGSLYYDGYEYEFEIDGTNGNIIKWEIDRD